MGNPSILSHVSVGTNDFDKARKFYQTVLATLGCKIIMEHPGAVAFGREYPEFWVGTAFDGKKATVGNGCHFGFNAASKEEVDRFYAAAIAHGAQADGEPGGREDYGAPYYGCFVRDLDGHKIEAIFWDEALAKKLGMG
ncbi:MAG: VOC family protein [Rhizobiales bacterium]|nr:VOC family protein [Hyphomicrobiales bacterium]